MPYDKVCTGVRKTVATTRACLKCDKEFASAGPFNRLCVRCNTINQRIDSAKTEYAVAGVSGGRVIRKGIDAR